jgi:hypothetical protein
MIALEILRAARELISTPDKWTQGEWGTDANGLFPRDGEPATRFCLWGACRHATRQDGVRFHLAWQVLERMRPGGMGAITFNDAPTTTHADVLALLDRAIAEQEAV